MYLGAKRRYINTLPFLFLSFTQITNRRRYVANRIVAIPMALSELQGPVPIASLCEYDFSYSCTAVDKISTDLERRAVPLRQPSPRA